MAPAINKNTARPVGSRPGGETKDALGRASARQSTTDRQKTQVRAADGRVVGVVVGDTLRKTIEKRHMLRTPPAIAWDVCALQQAEQAGAEVVEVYVRDEGTTYTTTLDAFREHGFVFDRGFGQQIGLSLSRWDVRHSEQPTLFTW